MKGQNNMELGVDVEKDDNGTGRIKMRRGGAGRV